MLELSLIVIVEIYQEKSQNYWLFHELVSIRQERFVHLRTIRRRLSLILILEGF